MMASLSSHTTMPRASMCILSLIFMMAPGVGAAPSMVAVPPQTVHTSAPTPVLPPGYSCVWNLTEGPDVAGLVVVSSGSTEIDQAGRGKQRELTVLERKSQLFPGRTFHMEVESITNYDMGGMWTRTCSNQTGREVCSCDYTPVSGSIPHQDPSDWTFIGDTSIDGVVCTQWQVSAVPSIVWTITKAIPNLLVRASLTDTAPPELTEQDFGDYVLGPPPPSRWRLPVAWNCSK